MGRSIDRSVGLSVGRSSQRRYPFRVESTPQIEIIKYKIATHVSYLSGTEALLQCEGKFSGSYLITRPVYTILRFIIEGTHIVITATTTIPRVNECP